MFFVVISRAKEKVLLFMRLVLVMCILCILAAQLYGICKASAFARGILGKENAEKNSIIVEQQAE